jgi:hypothetical protein
MNRPTHTWVPSTMNLLDRTAVRFLGSAATVGKHKWRATGGLVWEAIERLGDPPEPAATTMMWVAGLGVSCEREEVGAFDTVVLAKHGVVHGPELALTIGRQSRRERPLWLGCASVAAGGGRPGVDRRRSGPGTPFLCARRRRRASRSKPCLGWRSDARHCPPQCCTPTRTFDPQQPRVASLWQWRSKVAGKETLQKRGRRGTMHIVNNVALACWPGGTAGPRLSGLSLWFSWL